MTKRILFIVEGRKTEPRFIRKMLASFNISDESQTYVYGTNIHVLYKSVFSKGDPEDVDLLLSLKSQAENEKDKELLSMEYTDIFLVFDVEVQDPGFDKGRMSEMLEYFSNSTENGKLYLNYPMMESYRHMRSIDDGDYLKSVVRKDVIPRYKELVNAEGCAELRDPNRYDRRIYEAILSANALKYLALTCSESTDLDDYVEYDGLLLFGIQMDLVESRGEMYVINTSVLIVLDYNPRLLDAGN